MTDGKTLVDPGRLRARREEAKLTRPALAELTGLHPTHLYFLETGRRGITRKTRKLIADALGCDITDLMPDQKAA